MDEKTARQNQSRTSVLSKIFAVAGTEVPGSLSRWEKRITGWCEEYKNAHVYAEICEITLDSAVFLFDHTAERVTLAYAVSIEQLEERDHARIKGFPDVNSAPALVQRRTLERLTRDTFLGTRLVEYLTSTCFRIVVN